MQHSRDSLRPALLPEMPDYDELLEPVGYDFGLKRRSFMQILGAGLLIASSTATALAQRSGRRGNAGARTIGTRIHLGQDGSITVLAGKVEGGQGARAELTQAAAEELRVEPQQIQLVLADTGLVPDDGEGAAVDFRAVADIVAMGGQAGLPSA